MIKLNEVLPEAIHMMMMVMMMMMMMMMVVVVMIMMTCEVLGAVPVLYP
jgi:hypothetical protein